LSIGFRTLIKWHRYSIQLKFCLLLKLKSLTRSLISFKIKWSTILLILKMPSKQLFYLNTEVKDKSNRKCIEKLSTQRNSLP
jgi:hypothetical protein